MEVWRVGKVFVVHFRLKPKQTRNIKVNDGGGKLLGCSGFKIHFLQNCILESIKSG